MSSLLATHTAVRVARDVGYPKLEVPPPPVPPYVDIDELSYQQPPFYDYEEVQPQDPVDLRVPVPLLVFLITCLIAGIVILAVWGVMGR